MLICCQCQCLCTVVPACMTASSSVRQHAHLAQRVVLCVLCADFEAIAIETFEMEAAS